MFAAYNCVKRICTTYDPPKAKKSPNAIRIGILGAAAIARGALINPSRSHEEVVIVAVAARSKEKAEAFAKRFTIPKAFGGSNAYQDLIDDPDIDVVYNALPNAYHYEWTIKALAAGKHVLLEKPSTDTANDTIKLYEYAKEKDLIVMEANHYKFHPSSQRVKEIVQSGELGKLKSISSQMWFPAPLSDYLWGDDDIRYNYTLGGGILMDMGCYPLSVSRFIVGANPIEVTSAESIKHHKDDRVDICTRATLAFPDNVTGEIFCQSSKPNRGPLGLIPELPTFDVQVHCEGGTIKLTNFVFPFWYHNIEVIPKRSESRFEKAYIFRDGTKGEAWWSTFRYQLEAFVDGLRDRQPKTWQTAEDTIANIEWIEKIYAKMGMSSRPEADFELKRE